MMKPSRYAMVAGLALSALLPATTLMAAASPGAPQASTPNTSATTVYGWQLMTPAERNAYRAKMRSLKTPQERQAFRLEHHNAMQQRAKERGVSLPDMPMMGAGGGGMGMGRGMGPAGMGGNMGSGGMGRGRMGMGAAPAGSTPSPPPAKKDATTNPAPSSGGNP